MRRAFALLSLVVAPVSSRVFTGTLGSDNYPFMGRFAFGPNGGSGTVTLGPGPQTPNTNLMTAGWKSADWCAGPAAPAPPGQSSPISDGGSAPLSIGAAAPTFWYFSTYSTSWQPSYPAIGDTFTFTVTQSNGDHLSYEEAGLPAIYAVFWVWTMALAGAFIWALFFMAKPASFPTAPPLLIRVVLVTLVLTALSNMAHLTEWGFLSNTGKPSGAFLAVVGGLLRLSASCAVWVLAAVVATGYGVSTLSVGSFKDASNIKGVVALGALLLVGFILSIYFGAVSSAAGGGAGNAKFGCTVAQSGTTGGIWAGLIYLALTFSYLAFVIIRWRGTIAAEASLPRKSLLTFLGYAVISSFFILPLAEVIGACFRVVAPPPLPLPLSPHSHLPFLRSPVILCSRFDAQLGGAAGGHGH